MPSRYWPGFAADDRIRKVYFMTQRKPDGSAGDADYGTIGVNYSTFRRPEPRIAALIEQALSGARTVLNVGSGTGSYESTAFTVTAAEPSASMRAQRPTHLPPAIDAIAEHLPFDDDSFDAAMTTFSVHQWGDLKAGLLEVRRVTTGPIAVLTCDPDCVRDFWLYQYAPRVLETEARRYPAIREITDALGGRLGVETVPIPPTAPMGSMRPTTPVRRCCSTRQRAKPARPGASSTPTCATSMHNTSRVISPPAPGINCTVYGHLRTQPHLLGSLVLIRALPD
jgi:Methyltransferase domain